MLTAMIAVPRKGKKKKKTATPTKRKGGGDRRGFIVMEQGKRKGRTRKEIGGTDPQQRKRKKKVDSLIPGKAEGGGCKTDIEIGKRLLEIGSSRRKRHEARRERPGEKNEMVNR